jgi:HEAT repeat protein
MDMQSTYLNTLVDKLSSVDARGLVQLLTLQALAIDDVYVNLTVYLEDETPVQADIDIPLPEDDADFAQETPHWRENLYERRSLSLNDLWERHPYWMLLGSPGAGKSTFLRHQAVARARKLRQNAQGDLPLWLNWQDFALAWQQHADWETDNAILNYFCQHYCADSEVMSVAASELKIALASQNALLLCDSLDSVYDPVWQKRCMTALETVLNRYPGNRCLVTSRYTAHQRPVATQMFRQAFIEAFNDAQVDEFFKRWMYALEKAEDLVEDQTTRVKAEANASAILAHLHHKPELRDRLSTPFLCALVGVTQHQSGHLPEHTVDLYKLCVDTLILHGDLLLRKTEQKPPLARNDVLQVLEHLALQAQEHGVPIFESKQIFREAEKLFLAQGAPAALAAHKSQFLQPWVEQDSALLSRVGSHHYAFTHVLFQEYLAACAMLKKPHSQLLKLVEKNLFNPSWRGVIRMAAAHQGAQDEAAGSAFIKLLMSYPHPHEEALHYNFRLAFSCMLESRVSFQLADHMFHTWMDLYQRKPILQPALTRLLRNAKQLRYKPAAIAPLLDNLKATDATVRCKAAEALGHLQDPNSLPLLLDILKQDESPTVRAKAAEVMGEFKSDLAVPALLACLQNDTAFIVRRQCAKALGKIRHPSVVPALQKALRDREPSVRWRGAEALGYIKDASASSVLADLLRTDDIPGVRWRAAEALGCLHHPNAIEPLRHALENDHDTTVRSRAAEALGVYPALQVMDSLQHALKSDKFPAVRWRAAEALGKLHDPTAVPVLLDTLRSDVDNAVRWSAAEALGQLRDNRALEILLKTVREDFDPAVRWSAAEALGHLGDSAAVEALLKTVNYDKYASVRSKACQALGQLNDVTATPALMKTVEADTDPVVRRRAAEALGQLRDNMAVSVLLNCLQQENEASVRWTIVHALNEFHEPSIAQTLLNTLHNDSELSVRWQAARTLEILDLGELI